MPFYFAVSCILPLLKLCLPLTFELTSSLLVLRLDWEVLRRGDLLLYVDLGRLPSEDLTMVGALASLLRLVVTTISMSAGWFLVAHYFRREDWADWFVMVWPSFSGVGISSYFLISLCPLVSKPTLESSSLPFSSWASSSIYEARGSYCLTSSCCGYYF